MGFKLTTLQNLPPTSGGERGQIFHRSDRTSGGERGQNQKWWRKPMVVLNTFSFELFDRWEASWHRFTHSQSPAWTSKHLLRRFWLSLECHDFYTRCFRAKVLGFLAITTFFSLRLKRAILRVDFSQNTEIGGKQSLARPIPSRLN